jgi:hypothetical protein
MNHSKTILILLNGQAVYVGGSTVRVLEVEDVDIDDESLRRLAGRVSDRGVKCTEVANKPIRVFDCTEPVEDDFINEVEGLIDEE